MHVSSPEAPAAKSYAAYEAAEALPSVVPSMSDQQKIDAAAMSVAKQKSLELLYDYTKFHVGVYLTLTGSYLTAAFAKYNGNPLFPLNLDFIPVAIFFTMLAGFAGGVIVSSLTQWIGGSSQDFLRSKIGPWDWKAAHVKALYGTYIEHTAFWIGLICAVLSFVPPCYWHPGLKLACS